GSPYFWTAIKNCHILVYIFLGIIILAFIWGFIKTPVNKKYSFKKLSIVLIVFLSLHTITPMFLGKANTDLVWNTWKNPRNVYLSFNDSNKSMQVSGFFEYSIRDFYVTYLRDQKLDESELDLLAEIYDETSSDNTNKYTGKYEGKNLIFLQLEGIDSWLLNKEDTPTLYKMMTKSINFSSNHYSFYTGGGSTFNSEFAVNTGFIVPISYNQNAYSFSNNKFPYSMANLFKSEGYTVNAFHMNTKEYYSRSINYDSWGYDHYYGLVDMEEYNDDTYELDRELITNEDFSNLMFPEDKKFVDYIITYSAHLPFTNTSGVCKLLYDLDNLDTDNEFVEMTEEECARRQAAETDYMVSLLLDKLEANGLLDDTIIVVFTDHYLYTLNDQSILDKYKETDNNLINNTPFFIWDNGKTKKTIDDVTSQLNILPTVLNLFGIDYDSINYIGTDALDSDYDGIVFFSDYSWYDGNVYVDGGEVTNKGKIKDILLEEKNTYVNNLIIRNDLTLKYNYFNILEKK
ncbi:MAG TPA: LTA synthase family protein, partial [Bacilli bacterium]|nr:LTA synthase family protein [Bacilli bacterium]